MLVFLNNIYILEKKCAGENLKSRRRKDFSWFSNTTVLEMFVCSNTYKYMYKYINKYECISV